MEDQPNRSPQFKERAKVLGIPVDTIDAAGLFGIMSQMIKNNEKHIIAHANVMAMELSFHNNRLVNFFEKASIVFCDGFGVKLAAKLLNQPDLIRITSADWM